MSSISLPNADGNASRLGAQRPRICHVPKYVSTSGEEAIDLAADAGLILDDWQQFVLTESLGERPDGKWSAPSVGLVVGRQNGKGAILEARELWGLFLGGERLIIHTAHLQKTATQHFERMKALIRNSSFLSKRVPNRGMPSGKGSEAIRTVDGATIFFATRSGGGGRGLTSDLLVFDEAMYLSDTDVNALVPSLSARTMTGNIQMWFTGSAVDCEDTAQDGVPFARVREAGIGQERSTAFFEWSLPYDDPTQVPDEVAADPESHRITNPGYGIRISPEWVEHEMTVVMSARGSRVERLGVGAWPETSEDADWVIPRAVWASCAERNQENRIKGAPAFAIDVSPDRSWAAIGVAGRREDKLWQFAIAEHRRDTRWVVDRCVELQREHQPVGFVVDARSPAASLIDDLERADVRIVKASTEDYGNACGAFFDAVVNGDVRYPWPMQDLDDALSAAKAMPLGDRWKWARRSPTGADITPIVAVTLALWGSMSQPAIRLHDLVAMAERVRPTPAAVPEATRTEGVTFTPF